MKVHVSPGELQTLPSAADLLQAPTVYYNKVSVLFSISFLLNLAMMPLKAYTTEPLPWTNLSAPMISVSIGSNETFLQYEQRALAFYKHRYNVDMVTNDSLYYYDSEQDIDLLRQPIQVVQESEFTFSGLPGAVFYSNRARYTVKNYSIGLINATSASLVELGLLFGQPSSVSGIWVGAGPNNVTLLNFAAQLSHGTVQWLYIKFAFRCCLTIFIIYQLWVSYYCHYTKLVKTLSHTGFDPKFQTLEIVVGDPTCLILQNIFVSMLFAIDFWCSLEIVGQCFVRVGQHDDVIKFMLSMLYLSRTVWFAYLALNLTGHVLRRYGCEKRFAQADPTSVALAVALVVGPLTYFQLQLSFFVDIYQLLFVCVLPSSLASDYKEDTLPAVFYSTLVGGLPILYGFIQPWIQSSVRSVKSSVWLQYALHSLNQSFRALSRHRLRMTITVVPHVLEGGRFSQYNYNDWKHRVIFVILMHLNRSRAHITKEFKGGSIYTLFQTRPEFQRNAAFSFRGSDCYILAHAEDITISYRLSLVDALYLKPRSNLCLGSEKKAPWGNIVLEPKNNLVMVNLGESRWIL